MRIIGIIIGNQVVCIALFIFNLLTGKGIVTASAVYGLTTMVVVYPSLIIYLIYNFLKRRNNEK